MLVSAGRKYRLARRNDASATRLERRMLMARAHRDGEADAYRMAAYHQYHVQRCLMRKKIAHDHRRRQSSTSSFDASPAEARRPTIISRIKPVQAKPRKIARTERQDCRR